MGFVILGSGADGRPQYPKLGNPTSALVRAVPETPLVHTVPSEETSLPAWVWVALGVGGLSLVLLLIKLASGGSND